MISDMWLNYDVSCRYNIYYGVSLKKCHSYSRKRSGTFSMAHSVYLAIRVGYNMVYSGLYECSRSFWFHARNLDYWLSFIVMEVRRQDQQLYPPSLLCTLVAGIRCFIREERQWIFAANMMQISVWLMFCFVILFVCALYYWWFASRIEILCVQCIYFVTYFLPLCFTTVCGVL